MNFDKLFSWIIPLVIAAAVAGNLDTLQQWIWKAQAHAIVASRTSNWGSPKFFPGQSFTEHRTDPSSSITTGKIENRSSKKPTNLKPEEVIYE